jgi:HK97 family phage portal protein
VTVWQKPTGQPYYTVTRNVGGVSKFETLLPYEVLHIKGLTIDGIAGESVTSIHRDSIGTSIAAEQYGNFFFANGANPSGALVFPQELKKEQRDAAEKKISGKFGGVRNVGKTMVLDAGAKYEKFSLNPQEASLNDTRNFQVNQASRIFGVPVPLLAQMDKATLNNMETMGIQFVTLCLRPWAVQVEQEFAVKLLTQTELYSETYFFRFNFAGLLRGDTTARASYYKQALGGPSTGIGWMSVNEVRELENLDRVDDGDEVFTAEKMQASQNPEMAEPDDTTEEPDDTTEEPEDPEEPTNDTENGTPQASRKRAN